VIQRFGGAGSIDLKKLASPKKVAKDSPSANGSPHLHETADDGKALPATSQQKEGPQDSQDVPEETAKVGTPKATTDISQNERAKVNDLSSKSIKSDSGESDFDEFDSDDGGDQDDTEIAVDQRQPTETDPKESDLTSGVKTDSEKHQTKQEEKKEDHTPQTLTTSSEKPVVEEPGSPAVTPPLSLSSLSKRQSSTKSKSRSEKVSMSIEANDKTENGLSDSDFSLGVSDDESDEDVPLLSAQSEAKVIPKQDEKSDQDQKNEKTSQDHESDQKNGEHKNSDEDEQEDGDGRSDPYEAETPATALGIASPLLSESGGHSSKEPKAREDDSKEDTPKQPNHDKLNEGVPARRKPNPFAQKPVDSAKEKKPASKITTQTSDPEAQIVDDTDGVPPELVRLGWRSTMDPSYNVRYFYNHETKQSTWVLPSVEDALAAAEGESLESQKAQTETEPQDQAPADQEQESREQLDISTMNSNKCCCILC